LRLLLVSQNMRAGENVDSYGFSARAEPLPYDSSLKAMIQGLPKNVVIANCLQP
jgi:hypothetical protein